MHAFFRRVPLLFLLAPATGCGGATLGTSGHHAGSNDGGPSNGYPANMIAATANSGDALLSFFTYDTTTGFVPTGALSAGDWTAGLCTYVAFDSARNLYVGCQGSPQQPVGRIYVFPSGANGDAKPIRSVTSPQLATASLSDIAVDSQGNIYVVTQNYPEDGGYATDTLLIFGKGSDTEATRIIEAPGATATGSLFLDSSGVALDGQGNIYVASVLGPVSEFSAGASGEVSPIRSFSDGHLGETGLAVDSSGRLYVTTYDDPSPAPTPASVVVFGPDGAIERTIAGSATGLSLAGGIAADRAGRIYVSDFPGEQASVGLRVFSAGATGDAAPEATLPGVGEYGFAVAP